MKIETDNVDTDTVKFPYFFYTSTSAVIIIKTKKLIKYKFLSDAAIRAKNTKLLDLCYMLVTVCLKIWEINGSYLLQSTHLCMCFVTSYM